MFSIELARNRMFFYHYKPDLCNFDNFEVFFLNVLKFLRNNWIFLNVFWGFYQKHRGNSQFLGFWRFLRHYKPDYREFDNFEVFFWIIGLFYKPDLCNFDILGHFLTFFGPFFMRFLWVFMKREPSFFVLTFYAFFTKFGKKSKAICYVLDLFLSFF